MARYVDIENSGNLAEAMYNLFSKCHLNYKVGCFADDCNECIRRFLSPYGSSHLLPAADVAPVKHGHWIEEQDIQICSECGEEHSWQDYRASYCDNCGAKMDGEDGNGSE